MVVVSVGGVVVVVVGFGGEVAGPEDVVLGEIVGAYSGGGNGGGWGLGLGGGGDGDGDAEEAVGGGGVAVAGAG